MADLARFANSTDLTADAGTAWTNYEYFCGTTAPPASVTLAAGASSERVVAYGLITPPETESVITAVTASFDATVTGETCTAAVVLGIMLDGAITTICSCAAKALATGTITVSGADWTGSVPTPTQMANAGFCLSILATNGSGASRTITAMDAAVSWTDTNSGTVTTATSYTPDSNDGKGYCDRCGFSREEEDLVWQRGRRVCIQTCVDEPSYREVDDE